MSSLYFHIPFCRRKCPYCDFYSVEASAAALAAYPGLLIRQLELEKDLRPWTAPFDTVFFGGGTPSLLPPESLEKVLARVAGDFGLASEAEISMEVNPGTVTAESLAGYRLAGVNRLSFGIQSFSETRLAGLGRIHSAEQGRQAVRMARRAGFSNLGIDLMFALPGQGVSELEEELAGALELEPEHLSLYGLTVEEGTPFAHQHQSGALVLPDAERYAAQYLAAQRQLEKACFVHYEIANFARPGHECRHNLVYWRRRPYLGIGAGAHSLCCRGWGERLRVPADLTRYAGSLERGEDPSLAEETFDREGAMAETLYLGLRTREGVSEAGFVARFGVGVAEAFPAAVAFAGERLTRQGDRWTLDLEGWLLYDHLIRRFLWEKA